jgi:CheY-like chemotaxis protein
MRDLERGALGCHTPTFRCGDMTERLILRAPRLDDAKAVARFANDRRIAENTAHIPHPCRLADAEDFITAVNTGFALSPPQRRVLVVEDNCVIASLLTDQLNEFGYVVIGPAAKLADATAIASTSALDCALIDIALGEESALPVAQILTDRHIPFVFMTGASESPEGRWHDVPALLKPFTFEELRRALQHLLSEPDETPKSGL